MLMIPASIKQSEIHGLGLFSDEPIEKGTVVWKFDTLFDLVFDPKQVECMPKIQRNLIKYYAYLSKETGKYIFSGDDYRFINHANTPNLDSVPMPGVIEWCDIANRDIGKGEELLVNYRSFDAEPPSHL